MAKYLSQEWADAVVAALNGSDDVQSAIRDVDLTIQQVITGANGGEATYWTRFADGTVSGGLGEASEPDVVITQDYETATAMTRGELNPQAAFMQGKLKITGNMGKLLQHQGAMQAMFPVLAGVPTEY